MALTHLADTSVLTRLRREPVRTAIEHLVEHGRVARATISDLEIGYAARTEDEWDQLATAIGALDLVETGAGHLRRALQVQRLLAAQHQRGRSIPDLLVAAAAEGRDLVVLHYDADFDRIANVTGQGCEWIVPAGTVD